MLRKNLENPKFQNFPKCQKFQLFRKSRKSENLENFENFDFRNFQIFEICFPFFSKFHKKYFSKNMFKLLFRRDEKIFLLRIFFYDLDYISRLPQTYSEHSGSVRACFADEQGLGLKMEGNQ